MNRFIRSAVIPLIVVLLMPAFVAGQETRGILRGTVTDSEKLEPLSGANILLVGTTLGTTTDIEGTYSLEVPPGSYTILFRFVGYQTIERRVQVSAGAATELHVAMKTDLLKFEEVVVTGSGGLPATKARLGNSIGTISGEDLSKVPLTRITRALDGRTSGVQVHNSSGLAGTTSLVQLRGANSITGNVEPLIIIDGVRFTNINSYSQGLDNRGIQSVSALNLINPADIDRVEILKGASAATLYGSDAANGVIQIFTKSGAGLPPGTTTLTFGTDVTTTDWSGYYDHPRFTRAMEEVVNEASNTSTATQLSISGTGAQYRYYASGRYSDLNPGFAQNFNRNYDFKGNFTYVLSSTSQVKVGAGYTQDRLRKPNTDNFITSPWFSAFFKQDSIDSHRSWTNPYDGRTYYSTEEYDKVKVTLNNIRYTGNIEYSAKIPFGLGFEARVGYENLAWSQLNFTETGFIFAPSGNRSSDETKNIAYNAQAIVTGRLEIMDDLLADISYGIDYYRRDYKQLFGSSATFAPGAFGNIQLGTQSTFNIFEQRTLFTSGSMFLQSQFDFRKAIFLTLGTRLDKSSAFGQEAPAQLYPKASLAILLPVESLNPILSLAKVRASYGQAGRQPGIGARDVAFQKDNLNTTYQSFVQTRPGNSELKPAVTTEYEGGVDLSFLENRLGVELTYYFQETVNDVFSVATKPSDGFGNRSQTYNLGMVKTNGMEISVFGVPLNLEDVRLDARMNITTVNNLLVDDGGFPFSSTPFGSLFILRVEEGHSIPEFYYPYDIIDQYGDRVGQTEPLFRGKALPTMTGNFTADLVLFKTLSVTFNVVGSFGHKIYNLSKEASRKAGIWDDEWTYQDRVAYDAARLVAGPNRTADQIAAMKKYWQKSERNSDEFLEKGDYVKLREISLNYTLPKDFVQSFGLRSVSLTVAAQNVLTVTDYEGFDPEISVGPSSILHRGADSQSVPNPRQFVFRTLITL